MNDKHVFVDYHDIDAAYGVDLTGYRPQDGSPYGIKIIQHKPIIEKDRQIIDLDKPWDCLRAGMASIIKTKEGKYVAFYEAISNKPEWISLCYAESDDGVNWVKPNLGLVSFEGSKENNIVRFTNCKNIQIF